jgi:hypothetical protein
MNDADRRLVELAHTQRQVFTRAQAHTAGLSWQAIGRRHSSGLFVPVGTHTLTFAGVTLDWRGLLQAGLLDLGPGALVSGEAAAALHRLDGFDDGPLVYLVLRNRRSRTTTGHVTSTHEISKLDRVVVDGLACASVTRTVVELLDRVSREQVGNALDSGTRTRLTAPPVVHRRLIELGRQGRSGVATFDSLMRDAGVESWLERTFLELVAPTSLPRPAVQRTYRSDKVHIARVDFDFAPVPIIVEVGGRRGYMSSAERRRQERRRNAMQLLGKTIYFFTCEDVKHDPAYVLDTIHVALRNVAS